MTKFEFNAKYPFTDLLNAVLLAYPNTNEKYWYSKTTFGLCLQLGNRLSDFADTTMQVDHQLTCAYESAYMTSRDKNLRHSAPAIKWPVSTKAKITDYVEIAPYKIDNGHRQKQCVMISKLLAEITKYGKILLVDIRDKGIHVEYIVDGVKGSFKIPNDVNGRKLLNVE